ncbi:MAG: T9SS type A sorting domain-containing protein [Bacteroidetes bacterium]|nr:T9SS type A sorting domain-containing protein [Bacteroidota bacterium]
MKRIIITLIFYTLSININAQNNIVNSGNMQVHTGANIVFFGSFTNNGTYTQSAGTFTFDGTEAQSLVSNGSTTFYNLVIDNSSNTGVTFSGGNVIVTNNLTLTDGFVYTSASNLIVLNDNATVTGGSSSSYVIGPFKKIGNESFTFHVGKTGYYMPISISAPGNSSDAFTAEYYRANPKTAYGSTKDGSLNKVTDNEYWDLARNSGSSNVTVTLGWSGNTSNIGNLSDLRVTQWNGSQWDNLGNASTTGSTSSGTVTASSNATYYNAFAFGTISELNPLPVTLMSFTAVLNNGIVDLDWVTATEVNNDYFTVEKTINGKDFEFVANVKGAGNSSQKLKYHTVDIKPYNGISYYRLKQTNFDQSFTYSNLVPVNLTANKTIAVYPNPSLDGKITLALNNIKEPFSYVQICDINGKLVYSDNLKTSTDINYSFDLSNLGKGLYLLKITNTSGTETRKFNIQ